MEGFLVPSAKVASDFFFPLSLPGSLNKRELSGTNIFSLLLHKPGHNTKILETPEEDGTRDICRSGTRGQMQRVSFPDALGPTVG